ncbi:unnamed protein product [Calypogeia fissa]
MASATFLGFGGAAAVGLSCGAKIETQPKNVAAVCSAGSKNYAASASALSFSSSSISSSNGFARLPLRKFSSSSSSSSSRNVTRIVAAGDIQRSYIMIKPDGVQRGLVGAIISRFERKGFTLKGLKLFRTPQELAETHYGELKEKPFFPSLVKYIVSGPVVAMVWEGPGVVASARKLIGATNPLNAEPGTIRGDFGVNTGRNVIHGSDSPENGEREIALWFKEGELVEWEPCLTPWILE